MIVVYRLDELSHSHPLIQVQSDPLSRRFWVFFDRVVGTICQSPRTASRTSRSRNDHHRCACTTWLPDRLRLIVARRCWFPSIQSNLLLQYFVTNMYNTNLPGVNSNDLSESFCLITTKFFFTTTRLSSLIWYVFMFLSTIWCTLTPCDALARFISWRTLATGVGPNACSGRAMTHVYVWVMFREDADSGYLCGRGS